MWIAEPQLRCLGLRRLSERYWQCERRYDLPAEAYLSVFAHAREGRADSGRIDVCAFHVTFCLGADRVHFYYHESDDGVWEPGGHTSATELGRYGREPREMCAAADEVASAFVAAMGMSLTPRGCL